VWAETELDVDPPDVELGWRFLDLPVASAGAPDPEAAPRRATEEPSTEFWHGSIGRAKTRAVPVEEPEAPSPPDATLASAPEPEPVPASGPRLLESPAPRYPPASIRAGEEGTVLCRIHVGEDGGVSEVEIVESSGHSRLDQAAREALLRWRFAPRMEGGRAVSSTVLHPVEFVLTEG